MHYPQFSGSPSSVIPPEGRAVPLKRVTIEDRYEPNYDALNDALLLIRFSVLARGANPVHPLRCTALITIRDTSVIAPTFFAKASKKVELSDARESMGCTMRPLLTRRRDFLSLLHRSSGFVQRRFATIAHRETVRVY